MECILDHWWQQNQNASVEASPDYKAVSHTSEALPIKTSSSHLQVDKSSRVQPDQADNHKHVEDDRENSFGDLEGRKLVIYLTYDDRRAARNFETQYNFRVLYWAAYRGRQDIVEKIIRMGFSPFVEAHDSKSAIFGAIEGDQPETLRFILQFTYIPTNQRSFDKSKFNKDKYGNTAFHQAMRLHRPDIANILIDHNLANEERNTRGLLPTDMNHKRKGKQFIKASTHTTRFQDLTKTMINNAVGETVNH